MKENPPPPKAKSFLSTQQVLSPRVMLLLGCHCFSHRNVQEEIFSSQDSISSITSMTIVRGPVRMRLLTVL